MLKFTYLPTNAIVEKKIFGVGGFSKILCNYQSGLWKMITLAYKVGGWGEKRPKMCLRNIWMVPKQSSKQQKKTIKREYKLPIEAYTCHLISEHF